MREAKHVGEALPAETLDLVVFTTGIFAAPKRQETAEGIERDMAVSYLSRLAILRELAPRLGKDRPADRRKPRVFIMGFPGTGQAGRPDDLNAEKSYGAMWVPPGLIKTNIRNNFLGEGSLKSRLAESLIGLFMPTAEAYAETLAPLLVAPELEGHSGALFDKKGRAILPSPRLTDGGYVSAFIAGSEALVARARA